MLFKYKEIAPTPLCCDDSAHYAALHKNLRTDAFFCFNILASTVHRRSLRAGRYWSTAPMATPCRKTLKTRTNIAPA